MPRGSGTDNTGDLPSCDSSRNSDPKAVTLRAVLIGSVGVAILAYGAPIASLKMEASTLALDYSTPGAVFGIFAVALLSAGLATLTGGRLRLQKGEMIVIYVMLCVACAIVTMGIVANLIPTLPALRYYDWVAPQNNWHRFLIPHMSRASPSWFKIMLTDWEAIQGFYAGANGDIPWLEWLPVLGWWLLLLIPLYFVMVCIMAILRKCWVDKERVYFPLVQLPLALSEEPEPGRRVNSFLRNRLMWLGFMVPFVIGSITALSLIYPETVPLPVLTWRAYLLQESWVLYFWISWQTIGLAYLIHSDVALSVWFFGLLGSFYSGLALFLNFQSRILRQVFPSSSIDRLQRVSGVRKKSLNCQKSMVRLL